jgi:hypothetical protein
VNQPNAPPQGAAAFSDDTAAHAGVEIVRDREIMHGGDQAAGRCG